MMITREDKIKEIAVAICEVEYFGFDPEEPMDNEENNLPLWESFRDHAEHVLNTLSSTERCSYMETNDG